MQTTKICSKCGKENSLEANFCRFCGNGLRDTIIKESDKGRAPVSIFIIGIILGVTLVCCLCYKFTPVKDVLANVFFKQTQLVNSPSDNSQEINIKEFEESEADSVTEEKSKNFNNDESLYNEEEEQQAAEIKEDVSINAESDEETEDELMEEDINEELEVTETDVRFEIDPMTNTNYAAALDPSEFCYFDSGIKDFSFGYSKELYNDVHYDDSEIISDYGKQIQHIIFSGNDGSGLSFKLYERNDENHYADVSDYVHTKEQSMLVEPADILFSTKKGYGLVIITGYDKNNTNSAIYDMLKIEDDYIMQMIVSFPTPTDNNDKDHKWYVTECYYRMCGFSESSSGCRSYIDYLRENNQ